MILRRIRASGGSSRVAVRRSRAAPLVAVRRSRAAPLVAVRRSRAAVLGALASLCAALSLPGRPARAEPTSDGPPSAFGAAVAGSAIRATRVGPVVVAIAPRPIASHRVCGPNVCVHGERGLAPTLAAFEAAWGLLVDTSRWPKPKSDGALGGDPRLDVHLVPDARFDGDTSDDLRVVVDALDPMLDHDGGAAHVRIPERALPDGGCALANLAARAIAWSAARGLDVAETEVVVDGFSRRAADVVAPCRGLDDARMRAFQAKPWRAMTADPTGPAFLARMLDRDRGGGLGAVVPALLSMATQKRGLLVPLEGEELGPARFDNATTIFDVLETTAKDARSSLAATLSDYAVARALAESPPNWEWVVPVSTLPRRFAVRRGIAPTGTSFLRIELDRAAKNDAVEIDLSWEQGARFVFRLLALDGAGKLTREIPVPVLETARALTIEARHLEGVTSLVLAAINVGDPARPWHPDAPEAPSHGYEIGLFEGT